MQLRLPPALVCLVFGAFMYLLAHFLPVGDFEFFGRKGLIFFLVGSGMVIMLVAIVQMLWVKTTLDPTSPEKAEVLVTRGIYRFTRNPMYLGMMLFLAAWGLGLGNAFNTVVLAGFVYFMNAFQIQPEEEALRRIFGREYTLYEKAVRRWF